MGAEIAVAAVVAGLVSLGLAIGAAGVVVDRSQMLLERYPDLPEVWGPEVAALWGGDR